jgi:hypothetical protein
MVEGRSACAIATEPTLEPLAIVAVTVPVKKTGGKPGTGIKIVNPPPIDVVPVFAITKLPLIKVMVPALMKVLRLGEIVRVLIDGDITKEFACGV